MVAEIWRFNVFSKWWPSAIFDLLGAYWDPPRRPLDGLYRFAKFGWNRCSSFDNMKLSIFCPHGLKTPIHAPKIGSFRGISPLKRGAMSGTFPKNFVQIRPHVLFSYRGNRQTDRQTNASDYIIPRESFRGNNDWRRPMAFVQLSNAWVAPVITQILIFSVIHM